MLRNCIAISLYIAAGTIGYKAGLRIWDKIELKIAK